MNKTQMQVTVMSPYRAPGLVSAKGDSKRICTLQQAMARYDLLLVFYTLCLKKQDTKLLPITSPNVNRFSKFFHWQTHW